MVSHAGDPAAPEEGSGTSLRPEPTHLCLQDQWLETWAPCLGVCPALPASLSSSPPTVASTPPRILSPQLRQTPPEPRRPHSTHNSPSRTRPSPQPRPPQPSPTKPHGTRSCGRVSVLKSASPSSVPAPRPCSPAGSRGLRLITNAMFLVISTYTIPFFTQFPGRHGFWSS